MDSEIRDSARTSGQFLELARRFRDAAILLEEHRPKRKADGHAPVRFWRLHAISLHLGAFLLSKGKPYERIRGCGHDVSTLAELARAEGLTLRQKTREHLSITWDQREHRETRYPPLTSSGFLPPAAVEAALRDLEKKDSEALHEEKRAPEGASS